MFTLPTGERLRAARREPFRGLRRSVWWLRKTLFARPKPDNPSVVVPRSREEVRRFLGRRYFEPGWELSYSYRGEVLNMRRVEFVGGRDDGLEWWQVHVRGYDHPEGMELTAHFETEPAEHPQAHVDRVGLDVRRGNAALLLLLDAGGVPYRRLGEWPDCEDYDPVGERSGGSAR